MSDLGLQPREVWKQPSRLPAEGRLGSSENTSNRFFVACFALFAYVPLAYHSEPSILILTAFYDAPPRIVIEELQFSGIGILLFTSNELVCDS
jgi:hypothetical protein